MKEAEAKASLEKERVAISIDKADMAEAEAKACVAKLISNNPRGPRVFLITPGAPGWFKKSAFLSFLIGFWLPGPSEPNSS